MAIVTQGTPRGGLWRDVGFTTLVNSTAETTIFSTTISGGAINLNNKLTFLIAGGISTAILTPGTITFRVKYGTSSTTVTTGAIVLQTSVTDAPFRLSGFLVNKSSVSAQYLQTQLTATNGGIILTSGVNLGHSRPTMDSTIDQTFVITAQFSLASSSNTLAVDYIEVGINS